MRVVIVQYGDYRQAVLRFAAGGPEFYHDQKFTVAFVGDLAREVERLYVISCKAEPHEEQLLPDGVRSIGIRIWEQEGEADLLARVKATQPTHLILRSPFIRIFRWATKAGIRVLPLFADSFRKQTIGNRIYNFKLRLALNNPAIQVIGNHNLPASRNLVQLGVAPWKVVPFDYESRRDDTPAQFEPKSWPGSNRPVRLAYVGSVNPAKGADDAVEAVSHLRARGLDVHLTVVGNGALEAYRNRAGDLGISERVTFAGLMPHELIKSLMREHDVVIVPTRREFGEGMPGTIYEGLVSRTPLALSDHPIFLTRFRDGDDAVIFRASNPSHLAERVANLMDDAKLYERLSANSLWAWQRLQIPVGWGELMRAFLRDESTDRQWFRDYSLASARYDTM
jgi:glycosyltransferase involved in cell wall biosynthesis